MGDDGDTFFSSASDGDEEFTLPELTPQDQEIVDHFTLLARFNHGGKDKDRGTLLSVFQPLIGRHINLSLKNTSDWLEDPAHQDLIRLLEENSITSNLHFFKNGVVYCGEADSYAEQEHADVFIQPDPNTEADDYSGTITAIHVVLKPDSLKPGS